MVNARGFNQRVPSADRIGLAAILAAAVGLWLRRMTWRFERERAATINLIGKLICFVCILPAASPAYVRENVSAPCHNREAKEKDLMSA